MTENKLNASSDATHTQMETLIPWYVNGTLTTMETAAFQQHLATCETCQQELSRCQALVSQVPDSKEIWQPTPTHFAGILEQVNQYEARAEKLDAIRAKAKPGFLQKISAWLSQTPNPVRWTLMLETLAIAALTLLVVIPQSSFIKTGGGYETLSDDEKPNTHQGVAVRLVFAGDMTTQELSDLMKQAKAQIIQGPSAVGSYTVEIPTVDKERSLSLLRSYPKIKLAQPIE
jgi:Putative zinc-finger